jgi:general secretion pathway protein H
MRRRHGFTLLELIVVVFIISLFAALVFPSFSDLTERAVKSDARKMASLLRYLNDSSIYTKKTYSLKFDLPGGSLSWEGPDGTKTDKIKNLKSVTLQSKGEVREGEVTVFFGPLGLQENVEVHIADESGSMTVAFNAVSGRTKIIEDKK